jgi:hypothetical protein
MISPTQSLKHPLAILAMTLCTFLVLDNLVFRSCVYSWIQNPDSLSGQLYNEIYYERARPQSGKKEILVTGNSRIDWAFWPYSYNVSHPTAPFRFIRAAVAGTYEKMWYFILNIVDPRHNRYSAVVIPVASYRVDTSPVDQENAYIDVQMLGQVLSVPSWTELINSFSDDNDRRRAIRSAVLSSDGFSDDVQNLFAHPFHRIVQLVLRKYAGSRWQDDWSGMVGTMEDFRFDPEIGHIVAFPKSFNLFVQKETAREFQRPSPEDAVRFTDRNATYQARWLNKIIDLYKESDTRLIFLQTPRSPIPLPARGPIESAPDLRFLLHTRSNVIFVDEDAFIELEQPRYFYDSIHLNADGRNIFTKQLGDRVAEILGGR